MTNCVRAAESVDSIGAGKNPAYTGNQKHACNHATIRMQKTFRLFAIQAACMIGTDEEESRIFWIQVKLHRCMREM